MKLSLNGFLDGGFDSTQKLKATNILDASVSRNLCIKYNDIPVNVGAYDEDQKDIFIKVFNSVKDKECVDIKDRVYPLDYWICVLAFVFDISFPETLSIIKNKDYINILIDRFEYKQSLGKMNEIRQIINRYIDNRLKEKE